MLLLKTITAAIAGLLIFVEVWVGERSYRNWRLWLAFVFIITSVSLTPGAILKLVYARLEPFPDRIYVPVRGVRPRAPRRDKTKRPSPQEA